MFFKLNKEQKRGLPLDCSSVKHDVSSPRHTQVERDRRVADRKYITYTSGANNHEF